MVAAAFGTYWYVSERDFEPSIAVSHGGKTKFRLFGATYAETEESWTGQNRARTIVDENLVFCHEDGRMTAATRSTGGSGR